MNRLTRSLVLPATAAAMLLAAAPAWAHVEVDSTPVPGTGGVTLTFHVPNEEAPARTTSVLVSLPTEHPLSGVTPLAADGWTPSTKGTSITWTGGAITGTATEDFRVQVAALPRDTPTITFKVLQTYDSGETVAWIETAPPGAAEPEHPAPVLDVATGTAPGGGDDHSADDSTAAAGAAVTAAPTAPVAQAPATPAAPAPAPAANNGPLVGGISALVALAALGGLLAWRRRRPVAAPVAEQEEPHVRP